MGAMTEEELYFMNGHVIFLARDPVIYNIVEDSGTPLPFPVVTLEASDVDGDVLTYSFTPAANVSETF